MSQLFAADPFPARTPLSESSPKLRRPRSGPEPEPEQEPEQGLGLDPNGYFSQFDQGGWLARKQHQSADGHGTEPELEMTPRDFL